MSTQNRSSEQDPLAPLLRALSAERLTGMPADYRNPRRDLALEVEREREAIGVRRAHLEATR